MNLGNLDKTQKRGSGQPTATKQSIERIQKSQINLVSSRLRSQEPEQIFINQRKPRDEPTKSARKPKEIGSRTKTSVKPQKAAVVSGTSVVKRSLVSPERTAVPSVKRQSYESNSKRLSEERDILEAIRKANDNIDNLYENIKNSDRKSNRKQVKTDPRQYGNDEDKYELKKTQINMKTLTSAIQFHNAASEGATSEVSKGTAVQLLKKVKSTKVQVLDSAEQANMYGLNSGAPQGNDPAETQRAAISAFDTQNKLSGPKNTTTYTTTKKVSMAKMKKAAANNYIELQNPGIIYKIPQFQLTKNIENFDEKIKELTNEQQLRNLNSNVYQNQETNCLQNSGDNFVTTVNSGTSGKSRASSGIGYKNSQSGSGSGQQGRRRLIFQRENTEEKEPTDKSENFHNNKAYLALANSNSHQKTAISSKSMPRQRQVNSKQTGQSQNSIQLPKGAASIADIVRCTTIDNRPNGSADEKAQQLITATNSANPQAQEAHKLTKTIARVNQQSKGPRKTKHATSRANISSSQVDQHDGNQLQALESLDFDPNSQRPKETNQKNDGNSKQGEVALSSTNIVGLKKIQSSIVQGQKSVRQVTRGGFQTNGSNTGSVFQNNGAKQISLRRSLKAHPSTQPSNRYIDTHQDESNKKEAVQYFSGKTSITLKALQKQKLANQAYETNPNDQTQRSQVREYQQQDGAVLTDIQKQRIMHKQKLEERKSQRSINRSQLSRFRSQPSITSMPNVIQSIRSQKELKPLAAAYEEDQILIQKLPTENFHSQAEKVQNVESANGINLRFSKQTSRHKSVRLFKNPKQTNVQITQPAESRFSTQLQTGDKGTRYQKQQRADNGGSVETKEKGQVHLVGMPNDRVRQMSAINTNAALDEQRAISSGMGVIVSETADEIQGNKFEYYQKFLQKQRSHIVLSPITLKETIERQQLPSSKNFQKRSENGAKNFNSIQLRSARNLPEIKPINPKHPGNQRIAKIHKIDQIPKAESPAKVARAQQNKNMRIMPKSIDKLVSQTTPVTPAGVQQFGQFRIPQMQQPANKQVQVLAQDDQRAQQKSQSQVRQLLQQEARLDKLISENKQLLNNKAYANSESKPQHTGSSSAETENRRNGEQPYRNQARIIRKQSVERYEPVQQDEHDASSVSLKKTEKFELVETKAMNEDKKTVQRKNRKVDDEYRKIMNSDESVVFYQNDEDLPERPKEMASPSPARKRNDAIKIENLSNLSSIKKNSSQKKGDLNTTHSVSPRIGNKISVTKFDLKQMKQANQEMPSTRIPVNQAKPAITVTNEDLQVCKQISDIPKSCKVNYEFAKIIDNLDQNFQLFSQTSQNTSIQHNDDIIPKGTVRIKDLRMAKQIRSSRQLAVFGRSDELTPIKKGSDNNNMIEDLEALCDGLESFMAGSQRNSNQLGRPSFVSQSGNLQIIQTVPNANEQDVKFIQQEKSITASQQQALNRIGQDQDLEQITQHQMLTSPRVPASDSSVNLLLKLQQNQNRMKKQLAKREPVQQDIGPDPISFYNNAAQEKGFQKILDDIEIVQMQSSADRSSAVKLRLQRQEQEDFKSQQPNGQNYGHQHSKSTLEKESLLKHLQIDTSSMGTRDRMDQFPLGAELLSPKCNDISDIDSNNKQALFMSMQRSQASIFNEVEHFFPPANLNFESIKDSDDLENYNRQIDNICLMPPSNYNDME